MASKFKKYNVFVNNTNGGLPLKKYKEITNVLGEEFTRLANDFSHAVKMMNKESGGYLSLVNKKLVEGDASGAFSTLTKEIKLATKGYKWDMKPPNIGGYNACPDQLGTLRHELGHKIYNQIPRNAWREVYDSLNIQTSKKTLISKYAETNVQEGFSEAFSVWTHPSYGLNGKRMPKEIEDFMEDIFGKKKG
jgi:hypothetical protein